MLRRMRRRGLRGNGDGVGAGRGVCAGGGRLWAWDASPSVMGSATQQAIYDY